MTSWAGGVAGASSAAWRTGTSTYGVVARPGRGSPAARLDPGAITKPPPWPKVAVVVLRPLAAGSARLVVDLRTDRARVVPRDWRVDPGGLAAARQ